MSRPFAMPLPDSAQSMFTIYSICGILFVCMVHL